MISTILRWLLTLAAGVVAAATLAGLAFFILALIHGEPLQTTLGIVLDSGQTYSIVTPGTEKVVGSLVANRATLSVRAGGVGYLIAQGLDILLTGVLWMMVLIALRRFAGMVARGRPFERENVARLRMIGWSLIVLGVWAWIRVTVLPIALLPAIEVAGGHVALLPALSHGIDGLQSARIDARLNGALPIAGLLILVIAEAFSAGLALREDNEAIL
jgi:hypothetical protein